MFCLPGAAVLGLRVAKFAGYGFEKVTAPNANQQSGPEEDYGVKASEVAAGPMDTLLDVPPEREFVQSKSESAPTASSLRQSRRWATLRQVIRRRKL